MNAPTEFQNMTHTEKTSVTDGDFNSGAAQLWQFFMGLGHPVLVPPEQLATFDTNLLNHTLLSLPRWESFWGAALGIYTSKIATKGWYINSSRPRIREAAQQMLLNAGAGLSRGWIPFLELHLASYNSCTAAFVEIERTGPGPYAKAVGIHHLNPLRCSLTNDAEVPVIYYGQDGKYHELRWWQVHVFADSPIVSDSVAGYGQPAALRVYDHIYPMAAMQQYFTDKITGNNPQTLDFISGVSDTQLEEMNKTFRANQLIKEVQRGNLANKNKVHRFGGSAIAGLLTDKNLTHIRVALSEIPDGFTQNDIIQWALLAYAGNLGLDPNDLRPQTGQALGVGAQSDIQHEKQRGRNPELWANKFAQFLNTKVLGEGETFTWETRDLRDEKQRAEVAKIRAETRAAQITAGEITIEEARAMAVASGDLPREYLDDANVIDPTLADDEKLEPESLEGLVAEILGTKEIGPKSDAVTVLEDSISKGEALAKKYHER